MPDTNTPDIPRDTLSTEHAGEALGLAVGAVVRRNLHAADVGWEDGYTREHQLSLDPATDMTVVIPKPFEIVCDTYRQAFEFGREDFRAGQARSLTTPDTVADSGDGPKPVSTQAAHNVLTVLREYLRPWIDQSGVSPVMHEPDTGWGEHWVISWEGGGLFPWTVLATGGGIDDYSGHPIEAAPLPADVFCEPISACELGIYPPHTWDETAPTS